MCIPTSLRRRHQSASTPRKCTFKRDLCVLLPHPITTNPAVRSARKRVAQRSRTHFRWYRGRRLSFSCFVHPDSFSAVPRGSGPVFMFCAPGINFGCTEGVGSRSVALGTAENESGHAKYENRSRRPRYQRIRYHWKRL
jgi:hypothetical protein